MKPGVERPEGDASGSGVGLPNEKPTGFPNVPLPNIEDGVGVGVDAFPPNRLEELALPADVLLLLPKGLGELPKRDLPLEALAVLPKLNEEVDLGSAPNSDLGVSELGAPNSDEDGVGLSEGGVPKEN